MGLFLKNKLVAEKMLSKIKRFLFYLTITVQCVFFIHYIYSLVVNFTRPVFFTIYCVLFFLSILAFINYLLTHKYPKEILKGISRFLRIFKYFINFSLIAVNFLGMFKFGATFWGVLLLIFSLFSLIFQIEIEIVRFFIEQKIKKFKTQREERKNNPTNNFNLTSKLAEIKNKFLNK